MREIPLLATDDVVRRILSGAQTQDRRPLFLRWAGLPKRTPVPAAWKLYVDGEGHIRNAFGDFIKAGPVEGDAHWIRECWAPAPGVQAALAAALGRSATPEDEAKRWSLGPRILYRADPGRASLAGIRWRPSIHMPRRACRIVKPIVRAFVERVQEITEAGAMAEGVREVAFRPDEGFPICIGYTACDSDDTTLWPTAREAFRREIWAPLYPGSWERNDWVSGVEWARTNEVTHG